MPGVSKLPWRACRPLLPVLLVGALLAFTVGQRGRHPATPAVPLDDWDVPQLVAYLNEQGLGLRMLATGPHGVTDRTAFLTTTDREWADLNTLSKDPRRIDRWRGTLYCERCPGGENRSDLIHQWGDRCLVAGPFLLYGDRELLDRVGAALLRSSGE
jgi:hypothetical protein